MRRRCGMRRRGGAAGGVLRCTVVAILVLAAAWTPCVVADARPGGTAAVAVQPANTTQLIAAAAGTMAASEHKNNTQAAHSKTPGAFSAAAAATQAVSAVNTTSKAVPTEASQQRHAEHPRTAAVLRRPHAKPLPTAAVLLASKADKAVFDDAAAWASESGAVALEQAAAAAPALKGAKKLFERAKKLLQGGKIGQDDDVSGSYEYDDDEAAADEATPGKRQAAAEPLADAAPVPAELRSSAGTRAAGVEEVEEALVDGDMESSSSSSSSSSVDGSGGSSGGGSSGDEQQAGSGVWGRDGIGGARMRPRARRRPAAEKPAAAPAGPDAAAGGKPVAVVVSSGSSAAPAAPTATAAGGPIVVASIDSGSAAVPIITPAAGTTPIITPAPGSTPVSVATPIVTPAVGSTPIVTAVDGASTPIVTPFTPLATSRPAKSSLTSSPTTGSSSSTQPIITPADGSNAIITPISPLASTAVRQRRYAPPPPPAAAAVINIPSHPGASTIKARSGELTTVTLDASASAGAEAYSWSISQIRPATRSIDIGLPFPEPASFDVSLGPGEYLVSLRVAGSRGQATAERLLTVQRNSQPVAAAGGPYTGYVGTPVKVSGGRSSDPDGDTLKFKWTLSLEGAAEPLAEARDSEASFTVSRVGEYALTLEVDDGRGGISTTRTDLLVLPASYTPAAGAPAPSATAGASQAPPRQERGPQQQSADAGVVEQEQSASPLGSAGQQQRPRRQPVVAPASPFGAMDPAALAAATRASQPLMQPMYGSQAAGPTAGMQVPFTVAGSTVPQQLLQRAGVAGAGNIPQPPPNTPSAVLKPQCLFDKTTGIGVMAYDFLAMPALADLRAWANREWRDCSSGPVKPIAGPAPLPGSAGGAGGTSPGPQLGALPGSMGAGGMPSAPFGTLAPMISSPENVVISGDNTTVKVTLDASGSRTAPLKPILMWNWNVKRMPDGLQVAATGGKTSSVWLAPGIYMVTLIVTDLGGSTAATGKVFAVWPVAQTTAVIGSPPPFVPAAGDATEVVMSANGTLPAPGRNLTFFGWRVTSVPDGRVVASASGYSGRVQLPVGKYLAQMVAVDSRGGNATAARVFVIGGASNAAAAAATTTDGAPSASAVAVIALPPPAVPRAAGSGLTRVILDASGSAPAAGAKVTSVLWAVVALPLRTPAANATGPIAGVWLPPGEYQVGLLVSDSAGNTATVRKSFLVTATPALPGPPATTPGAFAPGPASPYLPAGVSASVNLPPIIRPNQTFEVSPGDSFLVTGVADPEGDLVALRWTLMEEATGATYRGTGPRIAVGPSATPGDYQLLLTAEDNRGGVSEAVARVSVHPWETAASKLAQQAIGAESTIGPASLLGEDPAAAALGGEHVQTAAPSIYTGRLVVQPRLPDLSLYQGAVLDVSAATSGLFDLSRAGWRDDMRSAACTWRLEGRSASSAAGGGVVYGCAEPARFRLHTPGVYTLTLEVTRREGGTASAAATVTVLPRPGWGDFYSAASNEAFAAGRCSDAPFFTGVEFSQLSLACTGVSLPPAWGAEAGVAAADAARRRIDFSWRLAPLTPRAAAAHQGGLARASVGAAPATFGPVAGGLYQVALVGAAAGGGLTNGAVGAGGPSPINAVYVLSTVLEVEPTTRLQLPPPPALCAGRAVKLAPGALALLPGQTAGAPRWSVAWADGKAATGKAVTLTGAGGSFTFVAQPGLYHATATVDVSEPGQLPRRLTGRALIEARPCFRCAPRPIAIATSSGNCEPAASAAARLVWKPRPAWMAGSATVGFAAGSDLSPGTRALTVVARSIGSNVTYSCTAPSVTIRDVTPPAWKLRRRGGGDGECLAPANGRWACWAPLDLVTVSDGCAATKGIQYQAACGPGTYDATCQVLRDGRVCLRAALPPGSQGSHTAHIEVMLRDGYGNTAPTPARVPITVFEASDSSCTAPGLVGPQAS